MSWFESLLLKLFNKLDDFKDEHISKRLTEIEESILQIQDALYELRSKKSCIPTEEDLEKLRSASDRLRDTVYLCESTERCLKQRFVGEPEGPQKFVDSEVFDYHYPE